VVAEKRYRNHRLRGWPGADVDLDVALDLICTDDHDGAAFAIYRAGRQA